ncbi:MAG: hypothetical protein KC609_20985, partial [Myxococcales bacterium]|nr:hypothetical protein [Myxococcales bacterium]
PNGEPAPGAVLHASAPQVTESYEAIADAGGIFEFGELLVVEGMLDLEACPRGARIDSTDRADGFD